MLAAQLRAGERCVGSEDLAALGDLILAVNRARAFLR
jgi:hypothetical protein